MIRRANDTNTGLSASVWSKDIARAERIAVKLQAGSVWVNSFANLSPEAVFGGHKESGIGGELGPRSLLAYCNAHVTHVFKL